MGGSFLYVFFQKEEHTALPMGTGNTGGAVRHLPADPLPS